MWSVIKLFYNWLLQNDKRQVGWGGGYKGKPGASATQRLWTGAAGRVIQIIQYIWEDSDPKSIKRQTKAEFQVLFRDQRTRVRMCSGGFAKCLGISLLPLSIVCVLCNILLFFPGGTSVDKENITVQVWYFGGIVGSGVLVSTMKWHSSILQWYGSNNV